MYENLTIFEFSINDRNIIFEIEKNLPLIEIQKNITIQYKSQNLEENNEILKKIFEIIFKYFENSSNLSKNLILKTDQKSLIKSEKYRSSENLALLESG